MKKMKRLLLLVLAMVMALSLTACFNDNEGDSAFEIAVKNGFKGTEQEWLDSLKGQPGEAQVTSLEEAVAQSLLSTVSITSKMKKTGVFGGVSTSISSGSGVIMEIDKTTGDMTVLTNYHVVFDDDGVLNTEINVFFFGEEYSNQAMEADYIGGSQTYDLAVLQVTANANVKSAQSNKAATISSDLYSTVGQDVIAAGNSQGKGISATVGKITKESENATTNVADSTATIHVLRTDAAINGGNSGGGLYNDQGQLIGIVNAKTVDVEVEGMGYAIPVFLANGVYQNIMNQYEAGETAGSIKVVKYVLGMSTSVTDSFAKYDQVSKTVETVSEVTVSSVTSGSLASTAGVKQSDVIDQIAISGKIIPQLDAENITLNCTKPFLLDEMMLYVKAGDSFTLKLTSAFGVGKEAVFAITATTSTKILD